MTVGVIGSGNWGTTLAHLIGQTNRAVWLWSRNSAIIKEINELKTNEKYTPSLKISENVLAVQDMKKISDECELIFLVVPSKVFRQICFDLGNFVGGHHCVVSATKGIENKTFRTMTEILKEETCIKKVGTLSGPNIAAEIIQGDPSGAVIASSYQEVVDRVIEVLHQPKFKVYGNKDIKGVEIGGALKNIIAIASGIATGLSLGNNAKAFLITRGIAEISRYGSFFGSNPKTFFGLAGIGDLIATCFSHHSRNHTFGRLLASGKSKDDILRDMSMVVEGLYTVQAVYTLSQKFNIKMPITEGIYKIIFEHANLPQVISELMATRIQYEDEGDKEEFRNITHMLVGKYPSPDHLR